MEDKRIDAWIPGDCKDYLMQRSEHEKKGMNQVLADILQKEMAREKGEIIEQQSLPIIREIIGTELRKQLSEQRTNLREDMHLEYTNEMKPLFRASDNRIAALLVKVFRHANIAQRISYTILARSAGAEYAAKVYEDASNKAVRDLKLKEGGES